MASFLQTCKDYSARLSEKCQEIAELKDFCLRLAEAVYLRHEILTYLAQKGVDPMDPHTHFKTPQTAGGKYLRTIFPKVPESGQQPIQVDVYRVLEAYAVACPCVGHAVKKLLCAGLRDKGDRLQDLTEALESVGQAIVLEKQRRDHVAKTKENYP